MSLKNIARTRQVAPRQNSIDTWLDTLDDDEREAAVWMLSNPHEWPQWALIDAFREEGFRVGSEMIGRWRRANGVTR